MRPVLLFVFALFCFAVPAFADDDNVIALPPSGTTIINLTVTEQTKLTQDTLNATLTYDIDGPSANDVQDRINKAVAQAVALAKNVPEVKTATGYYNVYTYSEDQSVDPRTGQPVSQTKKWRGSQSVELESMDQAKLLDLAGKIQNLGFTMQGLSYSLSPEKAESVHDDLMQKALKKLTAQARLAQTALGKGSFEILDVSFEGAQPPVYPMFKPMARMAMAADAAVAAPTAAAGESEVSLSATARVLLKP